MFVPLSILAAACLLVWLRMRRTPKVNLPPGPKGIPIFGNLFQLPSKLLFLKASEWAEEYGDIFSYNLLGQTVIVLNTAKCAADILDRLATKTSDRPPMIKAKDFLTRNMNFALGPKNDTWRMARRASHQSMNVHAARDFEPMMEEEATFLVEGLLKHPEIDVIDHLYRVGASIGYRSLYGGDRVPLQGPDPSRQVESLSMAMFCAMLPGGSLVDVMPLLKPIIAGSRNFRKQADTWFEGATATFQQMYSADELGSHKSLSGDLREKSEKLGLDQHAAAWIVGSLYFAAQDTTASALRFFFLAMLLYPETANAARKQLLQVVGDRPPAFSDRDKLPQIEAMAKEVLRWRPPVPLSLAHGVSEDFEYGGYTIPQGAIVTANVYTIGRDPALYANGDVFDPSRFIDRQGQVKQPAQDSKEDYLCFGHGRRICIGKDLAMNSLWITIAYLLWAFDFQKEVDAEGREVTPSETDFFDHGVTVQPMPFPVRVVPRFDDLGDRLGLAGEK